MQIEVEKIKYAAKKYVPQMLLGAGVAGIIISNHTSQTNLKVLAACYGTTSVQYQTYKHKVERRSHSNNWLKMHKQPMRRGLENKEAKGLF